MNESHVDDPIAMQVATLMDYLMGQGKWVPMREGLWDRLGDTPPRTAARLLLQSKGREPSIKISDIGCGSGNDMELFPRLLPKKEYSGAVSVVGCDVSEAMCKYCRLRGLSVIQGDFRHLGNHLCNSHLVWSNMGLIHLSLADFPHAVKQLSSYCVEGGVLGIGFKSGEDREEIDPADAKVPVARPTTYHSIPKVVDFVEMAGCSLVSTISIPSENTPSYGYAWVFGIKMG